MAKYEVEVYIEGVQMRLAWHDEREYWLGRKFLAQLDDLPESQRQQDPNHLEWYSITKDQFEDLLDFRKDLREKRKQP